jgi:ADP-ribosylglycohydrolase
MLIVTAIGDAYGAASEYAPASFVEAHNDVCVCVAHPYHRRPAGTYMDDTKLSLAIAELMISGGPWTREDTAVRFVEVLKRDP